ncbi:MAG: hypothetical protein ACK6CU_16235 [Deltaproteobacteria bacterium]|jgi:hypothetical protein
MASRNDGKVPKTIKLESYFGSRMTVSSDGSFALVSGQLGAVFRVDLSTWKAARWTQLSSAPSAMKLSPNDALVAISFSSEGGSPERVEVRDAHDGTLRGSIDARDPSQASSVIETLTWSADGARLLGVSSSAVDKDAPHLVVFDLAKKQARHLRVCAHHTLAAGFIDDRSAMVLSSRALRPEGTSDTDLWVLDVDTGTLDRKGDGGMDVVRSVERLPDGRMLATASYSPARVIERDGTVVFCGGNGGLVYGDGATIVSMDGRKNLTVTRSDGSTADLGKAAKASHAIAVVGRHLLLLQDMQIQVLPLR